MLEKMIDKLTVLRRGRELISNPESWVQGVYCVNDMGYDVEADRATRFCSVGALWRVQAEHLKDPGTALALNKARQALDAQVPESFQDRSVIAFNDRTETTHEEVLALWDRAIAVAEEEVSGAPLPEIEEVSEVRRETVLTG